MPALILTPALCVYGAIEIEIIVFLPSVNASVYSGARCK